MLKVVVRSLLKFFPLYRQNSYLHYILNLMGPVNLVYMNNPFTVDPFRRKGSLMEDLFVTFSNFGPRKREPDLTKQFL